MIENPKMTTEELIRMDPSAFSDILNGNSLSASTCEAHARNIAKMLGCSTFDEYLNAIFDVVVNHAKTGQHNVMAYYEQTASFFHGVSSNSDILERLTGLTLLSVTLRLEKLQEKKP